MFTKIKNFLSENTLMVSVLSILIMFFSTCSSNRKVGKLKGEIDDLKAKVELMDYGVTVLDSTVNTFSKTNKAVVREMMWDFLEIEELADKSRTSIIELKHSKNVK